MPYPNRKGDSRAAPTLRLQIQKSAFGGDGIAFHEGRTCFVEGALPGEEVEAEILQDKKDLLRLRAVEILESSPHRIQPPCPYYGRCGGCQYQHVSYDEELRLKESQLRDVLKKIAQVDFPILPIASISQPYGYRGSVTFHVQAAGKNQSPRLCFITKDNVTKIPVQSCDLLEEPLRAIFEHPVRVAKKAEKISFRVDEKRALYSDLDERFFRVRLSGQSFVVSSKGFFQNNLPVTELLCRKISEWVRRDVPKVFYDLYAGVGTFSLVCAGDVPKIVCVEESPYAVAALRMNREERKRQQMEIFAGKVEKVFPISWEKADASGAFVLMDPPRQGLEKNLAEFLASHCSSDRLAYVSCDIATLARDLKILLSGGHWTLQEIAPFDMFPRTKHIEAAVLLTAGHGRIS